MRLIAFFGPSKSGKDECARIVGDLVRPRPFLRIEFAEPIRWALEAMGVPRSHLRERKDEPCADLGGRTGREAMVALGEGIRAVDPLYYVRHALMRAEMRTRDDESVAISDGRTVDEARAVRDAGGLCVWVQRPSAAADAVLEPEVRALCQAEIDNSGDLDHLRREVERVLAEVRS